MNHITVEIFKSFVLIPWKSINAALNLATAKRKIVDITMTSQPLVYATLVKRDLDHLILQPQYIHAIDLSEFAVCHVESHLQDNIILDHLRKKDEICQAAYFCKNFLMNYINTKRYSRIICWGYIAHNSVVDVVGAIQTKDPMYCPDIIFAKHPTANDTTQKYINSIVRKYL